MSELDDLRATVVELADRLRRLEDVAELIRLTASYGPAVDSGSSRVAAQLWTDDGVFDVPGIATWVGHDEIAGMVDSGGHHALIDNGCAHVLTTPRITIDGDQAHGWNYAMNIRWDPAADRFWVARVSANTWHYRREPDGWRVAERVSRTLDGSQEARDTLVVDTQDGA